jgi:hypothetical protein
MAGCFQKGAAVPAHTPKWHPILACEEYQPGHWVMIDSLGKPYAFILILRRGDEVGYRVDSWAQEAHNRNLIGYYRKLKVAAEHGHQHFLAQHGQYHRRAH